MRKLTEIEAVRLLGWPRNFHMGHYLEHPALPLRFVLDWESGYIGDVAMIASAALAAMKSGECLIHWVATPGLHRSSAFDDTVLGGLAATAKTDWPLILQAGTRELDLLEGYVAYKMSVLADHTLLRPGADRAVGFTNDGECFLYGKGWSQSEFKDTFGVFGDEFKEVSNQRVEDNADSASRDSRGSFST
jgi:hypothetical protein